MQKTSFLSLLFFVFSLSLFAQPKIVCITVDDLPTVHYGVKDPEHKLEITQGLIKAFTQYQATAIGYVNEGKLYPNGKLDSAQIPLLALWLENGLDLGNHSYSHFNYHKVSFRRYADDILKGEKITRGLVEKYGRKLKYFRHPYLRSGENQVRTDSLLNFLETHGYTEAPVTIDNEDYLFALAYSRAYRNGDTPLMKQIGKRYLDYMEQKLLFFEAQAQKLFGRNIAQTLLVHASYLNAQYMDALLKVYKKHGYTFVSQEKVLEDPAYQEVVTHFGDWGISWLDRWALSRGKRGEFFKGDPKTPAFIKELAR